MPTIGLAGDSASIACTSADRTWRITLAASAMLCLSIFAPSGAASAQGPERLCAAITQAELTILGERMPENKKLQATGSIVGIPWSEVPEIGLLHDAVCHGDDPESNNIEIWAAAKPVSKELWQAFLLALGSRQVKNGMASHRLDKGLDKVRLGAPGDVVCYRPDAQIKALDCYAYDGAVLISFVSDTSTVRSKAFASADQIKAVLQPVLKRLQP
jgi:hypothetical protein